MEVSKVHRRVNKIKKKTRDGGSGLFIFSGSDLLPNGPWDDIGFVVADMSHYYPSEGIFTIKY